MGLDVALRIKNLNTGELQEVDSFRGSSFEFIQEYAARQDLYGKDIEITQDLYDLFVAECLLILRKEGFEHSDLGADWGIMGFLKQISLRDYWSYFGYTLCVNADW
jgi:hypothetical protein